MGEVTKLEPLVLGYAVLTQSVGEAQRISIQAQLSTFAFRSSLMLGVIYFDRWKDAAAGYSALLAAIADHHVTGVVVPSLDHLGNRKDERIAQLEDVLGVAVHVADAVRPMSLATRSRP